MSDITESPKANNARFPSARALFEHLEAEHGFQLTAPVDLDAIAALVGVEVEEFVDLGNMSSVGKISLTENGPKIWINPLENSYTPRRRFTLAHELGHYCLHLSESRKSFVDTKTTMNRTESYWDVYESEANNFAAELLMPKQLIISEGNKIISSYKEEHGDDVSTSVFTDLLAKRLGASNKAMEFRLSNLGIIKKK
ncbi:ImmA/IrrE family metallo-endopeptidase [Massilia sp. ST3]|uniref:ImmA/IrrE family metallo-endopeptidase n=1 Tax=Massilia sp. ST3 TaxID=2824903 RepID=UPI001B83FD1B|nr:ImmA/IrrE family metallo-endopeptidase [Massilia sp. ST3]MBQ5946306.1 ImmA/IrrE family metallo-endopeptidase [Massilia sp. ST3]